MFDAERVVEMSVGIGRQHGFEPVLDDEVVQGGILAGVGVPGVDDDAFTGFVPEDVGVLLYGVERQTGNLHGSCVLRHYLHTTFRL